MMAANDRGVEALRRGDYEAAARLFREALGYVPDEPTVKGNLTYAESQIEARLAEQKREAEAHKAISQGVERLATVLSTPPPASAGAAADSGLSFLPSASADAPECAAGRARASNQDPTAVDLRCASTLTVDPGRVKGNPAAQPGGLEFAKTLDVPVRDAVAPLPTARPDGKDPKKIEVPEATRTNANYQKGFDMILAGHHTLAVEYFKKAKAERGDDVLVKNALLLAEDLARVHRQKDEAAIEFNDGVVAMINGDFERAFRRLQAAVKLEPGNERYLDTLTFVRGIRTGVSVERERMEVGERQAAAAEAAVQLARKSSIPWSRGDRDSAIAILEVAHEMSPSDPEIQALLKIARGAK